MGIVESQRGRLNGVDISDKIGNGDVRRGQLLAVSAVSLDPFEWRIVAVFLDQIDGMFADGIERVALYFTTCNYLDFHVEKIHEASQDPGLCLTPQPEKDDIMT